MPLCIIGDSCTDHGEAVAIMPQVTEASNRQAFDYAGQRFAYVPVCRGHYDGWWDGSDYNEGMEPQGYVFGPVGTAKPRYFNTEPCGECDDCRRLVPMRLMNICGPHHGKLCGYWLPEIDEYDLPYSVGRVDGTGTGGPMRFANLEDAEAEIARIERIDPEGVHRGDYYIDGPDAPDGDPSEPGHPRNLRSDYDADQTEAREF